MRRWVWSILRSALSIIGVWPIVKLVMRHRYPQQRILDRLLFSNDQTAHTVYMNQHREAVDNIIWKTRNFWWVELLTRDKLHHTNANSTPDTVTGFQLLPEASFAHLRGAKFLRCVRLVWAVGSNRHT